MNDIKILYEDHDLAVISKPTGMVVNRTETIKETTIQDWWQERLAEKAEQAEPSDWESLLPVDFQPTYGTPAEIFAERGGVVHRLDRETSGALLLAKNPGALVNLLHQFKTRQVEKTYLCLVHGRFQVEKDTVSLPLGRAPQERTRFAVDAEGRGAETAYEVQQFFPRLDVEKVALAQAEPVRLLRKKLTRAYQGFSLVKCWPKTGRTHQIRVHMTHLKHPLVSDLTYLGKKRSTLDLTWCPRLFLHAQELQFMHPRSGKELQFTAELDADLTQALNFLCLD